MLAILGPCAAVALVQMTPPVTPLSPERVQKLVKQLEQRSDAPGTARGVHWSSLVIGELGQAGPDAIPPLVALFEDRAKSGWARAHAAVALSRHLYGLFTVPDPRVMAVVHAAIKDDDSTVRWGIVQSSIQWRPVPNYDLVRQSVRESHPNLPSPYAISFPSGTLRALLPDLAAAVRDADPEVAKTAAGMLRYFALPGDAYSAHSGIGVTELLAALDRKEKNVHVAALRALGPVGRDNPSALKAVMRQLDNKDDLDVYCAAIDTIGWFGPRAKAAVPKLIAALKDARGKFDPGLHLPGVGPPAFHLQAVMALGRIGPDAKEAVPLLFEHMQVPQNWPSAQDFVEALERIDPKAGKTARAIQKQREDHFRNSSVRPPVFGPGQPTTQGSGSRKP